MGNLPKSSLQIRNRYILMYITIINQSILTVTNSEAGFLELKTKVPTKKSEIKFQNQSLCKT